MYPFAVELPSSHDNLCGNLVKCKGEQDNRVDSPTENWTSSGGLADGGVRLFFRLPIMNMIMRC